MKNLFALFIAIDDYPPAVPSLRGCVNDVKTFEMYLNEKYLDAKDALKVKWVTNTDATRQNIIDGFDHFKDAKDGDICLLYYSGHGSQVKSPEEFHHMEANKQCQTMVCYDSRVGEGRDLVDKELSYLLWKYTHDKDLHFVVIMDCCHSGGNVRDLDVFPRMVSGSGNYMDVDQYLGVDQYMKVETSTGINLTPPRGKYIQLAAARDKETAKEMSINGSFRGIFSFSLVKLLLSSKGILTYSNIIEQLGPRIALRARDQSPQLDTTIPAMKNASFLDGSIQPYPAHFLISFDRDQRGWMLNAGETQGIKVTGTKSDGTILALEDGSEVKVTQTFPEKAQVDGNFGMSVNKQHIAFIKQPAQDPLKIAFAREMEESARDLILKKYKPAYYPLVALDAPLEDSIYWLWCEDERWWLTRPGESEKNVPLFPKMKGMEDGLILMLLDNFTKVAKGVQLMELSNPQTTLNPDSLEVQVYKVTEIGNTEDSAPAELMDLNQPLVFEQEGEQENGYRVKIKNTSSEVLWVSALYIDDLYEISNKYLPKRDLDPGSEVWLTEVVENKRKGTRTEYKTLVAQCPEETEGIEDYIKIIACTEEFNTDKYNQEAVKLLDEGGPDRRGGRSFPMNEPDWMTKEFRLIVKRK
ncbi:MAG: caspase family protein [Saprospiraceae bacterium]|jgi:hypothetical protein|nr:caspase family protein [Saprospiraceae bacterium]